jgi:hypothetical protein
LQTPRRGLTYVSKQTLAEEFVFVCLCPTQEFSYLYEDVDIAGEGLQNFWPMLGAQGL